MLSHSLRIHAKIKTILFARPTYNGYLSKGCVISIYIIVNVEMMICRLQSQLSLSIGLKEHAMFSSVLITRTKKNILQVSYCFLLIA
jgi:hypothetical protein